MKKVVTLLLIFSVFALSFANYKVVVAKALGEQKLLQMKNSFDFPAELDNSKETLRLIIPYVFKYRLNAVVVKNLLKKKYFDLALDPYIENVSEENTPDAIFKVLGYPFKNEHSSILYSPKDKVDEIEGKVEDCKNGKLSLENFAKYVKSLPEKDGIKAYGYCRLAYLYINKNRAKSAEIFKKVASNEIEVSEYDKVDAMMQYARALHYSVDYNRLERDLFYQKKYALNNYKAFWIYEFVEKYIQESPFKNELETKFNRELYKELVAIMLERARAKKVPFEEVRKYADEVLLKVKDEEAKDYVILMRTESYYFAKDYEKFTEEGEKVLSEKKIKANTPAWAMLLNLMGYSYEKIGKDDEALKCYTKVLNSMAEEKFLGIRMKYGALYKLAKIYIKRHEEDKARPFIKKYAEENPELMEFFPYNLDTDSVYSIIMELNNRSAEKVTEQVNKKIKSMGGEIE